MRKIYLAALALALAAMPLSAQSSPYAPNGPIPPYLEFKTGMNYSPIDAGAVVNTVREVGMNVGLGLVMPVTKNFSFSLGVNYSERGLERTLSGLPTLLDLTYIEVPALFRFRLMSAGPVSVNALFGASGGYEFDCAASVVGPAAPTDCSGAIHDYDIGGLLGLGLSFGINDVMALGVDGTYYTGMRTIGVGALDGIMNSTWTVQSRVGFSVF